MTPAMSEISAIIGVRSSIYSATTWMTPSAFCSLPRTPTQRLPNTTARNFSNTFGQTIDVGDAGLVLDGLEHHALGRARPLPDQHQARDLDDPAAGDVLQPGIEPAAGAGEPGAQERHRMGLQGKRQRLVVIDHLLAKRHRRQVDIGFVLQIVAIGERKQRQPLGARQWIERLDRPQRIAAFKPEGAEAIGLGQLLNGAAREARAHPQVAHTVIAAAAAGQKLRGPRPRQSP